MSIGFVVCMVYVLGFIVIVFFFKQKTAYEMRISDWSSDVCSSDLAAVQGVAAGRHKRPVHRAGGWRRDVVVGVACAQPAGAIAGLGDCHGNDQRLHAERNFRCHGALDPEARRCRPGDRSEEHTSELQSLMRISYAVFCLKNKTTTAKQRT